MLATRQRAPTWTSPEASLWESLQPGTGSFESCPAASNPADTTNLLRAETQATNKECCRSSGRRPNRETADRTKSGRDSKSCRGCRQSGCGIAAGGSIVCDDQRLEIGSIKNPGHHELRHYFIQARERCAQNEDEIGSLLPEREVPVARILGEDEMRSRTALIGILRRQFDAKGESAGLLQSSREFGGENHAAGIADSAAQCDRWMPHTQRRSFSDLAAGLRDLSCPPQHPHQTSGAASRGEPPAQQPLDTGFAKHCIIERQLRYAPLPRPVSRGLVPRIRG